MRLAISNIAWPTGEDETAASILREEGAEGVEIAPTKVWTRPLEATKGEILDYRARWEKCGLRIVALQSLLFGRPDLVLFGDPATRRRAIEFLKGTIDLAAGLGAEVLVFGSPKNRLVGQQTPEIVMPVAISTFRELGDYATSRDVAFCLEPNPTEYGCDFITTVATGADLVDRVDSGGFRLHLDTAAMTMAGDDPAVCFPRVSRHWSHFHVSEPYLGVVGEGVVDHREFASAAFRTNYRGWTSIEMKEVPSGESWSDTIRGSLDFVKSRYGLPWNL